MTYSKLVSRRFTAAVLVAAGMIVTVGCAGTTPKPKPSAKAAANVPAEFVTPPQGKPRGGVGVAQVTESKLPPMLSMLYEQVTHKARGGKPLFTDEQLAQYFGIHDKSNPSVMLAITLAAGKDAAALKAMGVAVYDQLEDTVYGSIAVADVQKLEASDAVKTVKVFHSMSVPQLPQPPAPDQVQVKSRATQQFDRQGLTGKGVVVGIIDSGIDWRHPDFINPDGSSRILYLWDFFDNSYATSGGTIGSQPPPTFAGGRQQNRGTLYTRDQITAALRGQGQCHSVDKQGHGTAVAGTAAGNGRGGTRYTGVAPEADLIVVRASAERNFDAAYPQALPWIVRQAQALGRPCVINMSLGGHVSAHDGSDAEEEQVDKISGAGKDGIVVCIAAGNQGRYSFHAASRFGSVRPGQLNVDSELIELFVKQDTWVRWYFKRSDHWGLLAFNQDKTETFYTRTDGKQFTYWGKRWTKVQENGKQVTKESAWSKEQLNAFWRDRVFGNAVSDTEYNLVTKLAPGRYWVRGFGADQHVTDGSFAIYVPTTNTASFGIGATKRNMVGTPGNSAAAITVGSYDFQSSWTAPNGQWRGYNLKLGDKSTYTSPGYRRDKVIKPDITSPGQYMISSLASGSAFSKNQAFIVETGRHIAWNGTSAATPYTTGVVALMLQKNPNLDAEQVRKILISTADKDTFTGAVPNVNWGYGKLDPIEAIKKTPKP